MTNLMYSILFYSLDFLRSYTINHLEPERRYKMCIAVRDDDLNQGYVQLSCTIVQTQGADFMLQGISHTSNIAVALTLSVAVAMTFVICIAILGARKYKHR